MVALVLVSCTGGSSGKATASYFAANFDEVDIEQIAVSIEVEGETVPRYAVYNEILYVLHQISYPQKSVMGVVFEEWDGKDVRDYIPEDLHNKLPDPSRPDGGIEWLIESEQDGAGNSG